MSGARLELRSVCAGPGSVLVLDRISLTLSAGESLALVGPNAAGKSTLVQVASGALAPASGEVLLDARPLPDWSGRERAQRLALVPQSARWDIEFTVRELVGMGRAPHLSGWAAEGEADRTAIESAMATADVSDLCDRSFATLSGGERQRVLLARALAQSAPVLLLDEPTAHLDLAHQLMVIEIARRHAKSGGSVLMVLHDLTLAARLDRVAVLDGGTLVTVGEPSQVLTPERLAKTWGVRGHWANFEGRSQLVIADRLKTG